MRLILVRHAESEHAQRGVIAGVATCSGLTSHGVQQAHALADRFRRTEFRQMQPVLLSSPVLRARQTADILRPALAVQSIQQEQDLCEIHPGVADGMTWDTYRAMYGTFDLMAEPDRCFAPGGESWNQHLRRVQQFLQRLAAAYGRQTVIAVTHAGFIVVSMLVLFDIPRPGTGTRIDPAYTSLTEWQSTTQGWHLVHFNDITHLDTRY